MPEVWRQVRYWQCFWCRFEWQAGLKKPKHCQSCKKPDWYDGRGAGKLTKASIVRPVSVKGKLKPRVLQHSGQAALKHILRVVDSQTVSGPG